jgi:TPP-dependent pyruvate/acetoin dehydrogenase alpha subunit
MHVAEIDKGMLGANGIVSGGFGLATGAIACPCPRCVLVI